MVQIIALVIFIISVGGIFFILGKKVPALVQLPHNGSLGFKKHKLIADLETKIKAHHFHLLKKQMWLHKLLSFIKVLILKIETKIDHLLQGIRKNAQELDKKMKGKK